MDVRIGQIATVNGTLVEDGGALRIAASHVAVVDGSPCERTGTEVDVYLTRKVNVAVVGSLAGAQLERLEGMLVEFAGTAVISSLYELQRYGRIDL